MFCVKIVICFKTKYVSFKIKGILINNYKDSDDKIFYLFLDIWNSPEFNYIQLQRL